MNPPSGMAAFTVGGNCILGTVGGKRNRGASAAAGCALTGTKGYSSGGGAFVVSACTGGSGTGGGDLNGTSLQGSTTSIRYWASVVGEAVGGALPGTSHQGSTNSI